MKRLFLLVIISTLLFGCGKRELIKLTLVFDAPLNKGKYPTYFKDIVLPFESEECETEFLLKPINVVRLDINKSEKETNAWYFENTGDNTVEFSKGWLTHYFTDSLVTKYLVKEPVRKTIGIDRYLKDEGKQVLLYSENSDMDEYKGHQIYSSAKDINNKIKEFSCENKVKGVIVIINPNELKATGGDPPGPDGPCNISSIAQALDLKEELIYIYNPQNEIELRIEKAIVVWEKYFDKDAYIASLKYPKDNNPDIWDPGEGQAYFTGRLAILESITDVSIIRMEKSKTSGKISGMHIIECHDAIESL